MYFPLKIKVFWEMTREHGWQEDPGSQHLSLFTSNHGNLPLTKIVGGIC